MLKKAISYLDLDNKEQIDVYYFNFTKAELAENAAEFFGTKDGDLAENLKAIIANGDSGTIIKTFKNIVLAAVGKRSVDGKRFIKNEDIRQEFVETGAYSELFMELVTNATAAADFIRGVMPQDLANNIPLELPTDTEELLNKLHPKPIINVELPEPEASPSTTTDLRPAWVQENRDPTREEMLKMSNEELQAAMLSRLTKR